MKKLRPGSRLLVLIQRTLLLAGVTGLGLWFGSVAAPSVWQDWDNWSFDRQIRGESSTIRAYLTVTTSRLVEVIEDRFGFASAQPQTLPAEISPNRRQARQTEEAKPRDLENNALIGRLSIPRLHLATTVREGTGRNTLALAAGHIRQTSLPGESGNVAVAAHRDTLFRALAKIRESDLIRFETFRGSYGYRVESIDIVSPEEVSVLNRGPYPELTLVTCYPFYYLGSAPKRFIVKAREVSAMPSARSSEDMSRETASEQTQHEAASQRLDDGNGNGGKIFFNISTGRSRQLAPGISMGVDKTDPQGSEVDGWMWIMPDRHTVWLKHHAAQQPVTFYQRGERRELLITEVTDNSAAGYLRQNDSVPFTAEGGPDKRGNRTTLP
jgi:sortase A